MSTNGNGSEVNNNVPPDIEWDENNPPIIFACSEALEHLPTCDGSCGEIIMTESHVKLSNEGRAFARIGMSFNGLPMVLRDGPFNGIMYDGFDERCARLALQTCLVNAGIVTQDEIDEEYRTVKYNLLHEIRMQIEPEIKKARTKALLGIPDKPRIVGPHGENLG